MKRMLLIFCAACSLVLQAQTLMVNNFESATIGDPITVIWGAGSAAVVANPHSSGINTSANVVSVTNNAWVPVSFPITLPAGKTWADYDGVRVKLCPTVGADLNYANIEIGLCPGDWGMTTVGSANAWSTATIGTWYSADIAFDQTKLAAYLADNAVTTNLIVKYNKGAGYNVLIDDIQLIEHQDPNREVTVNFEDEVIGTNAGMGIWWGSFGLEVVANPVTTGINQSSKAFKVTYPSDGGAIAMNILPVNGTWNNYDNVTFKVLALAYDAPNPWSQVFVGGGPDTWTGGTSQLSASLGVVDLNTWYSVTVPITSVTNPTQPFLNLQANGGVIYLLDDVSLLYGTSTAVKTIDTNSLKVARVSSGQYEISLDSEATYKVLNLEGRVIISGNFVSGRNSLQVSDLASGVYILQTASISGENVVKIIR